ncbi:MAG TPA: class I SAM-dependent methyltransferase [Actinomycetes bacterium]|nr:class I SAM-dependent methyltransferase [Actinomycetes bacterium]
MEEPGPVAAFRALLTTQGQEVLDRVSPYDEERALATAETLRAEGVDPALTSAALTQARLRARARDRLGPAAERMFFTAAGLEQATRASVAAHRAQRYAGLAPGSDPELLVADLCCGLGSDLLALARVGAQVLGVERDPLTAAVAAANVDALGLTDRAAVRVGDVTEIPLDGVGAVFVDPARRDGHGRALAPHRWSPPFAFVTGLAGRVAATGAKLAPGVPHDVLPAGTDAEWVSDSGDLVECALWFGPLATGVARRATLLPSGASLTGGGSRRAEAGPVGRYLVEPDPAVIRAGLVAELADQVDGRLVDPTIAYLSTEHRPRTVLGSAYEVTDVLPFGVKRLRALLRERGVGRVTVKKRGTAVTPEQLRPALRLRGDAEATVVLTRVAGEQSVLIVEPLTSEW